MSMVQSALHISTHVYTYTQVHTHTAKGPITEQNDACDLGMMSVAALQAVTYVLNHAADLKISKSVGGVNISLHLGVDRRPCCLANTV